MTHPLRKILPIVFIAFAASVNARDIDIELDPEIDVVFEADKCKQVHGHNLRCVFLAKKPGADNIRINAYSIEMVLWNKDTKIGTESVPNGDLDSGDSYKHLIRSSKPITRIVFRLHSQQ